MSQDISNTSLTIYNNDLGVVNELRPLILKEGINEVFIHDVPSEIIPSSVRINLDATVIEQN
jgi:hypothetical protein